MKKLLLGVGLSSFFLFYFFSSTLALWLKPWFPLNQIKVQAPYLNVTRNDIAEQIKPFVQDGMLMVDGSAIEHVLKTLPWISSVSVSRKWPDSIVVRISEKRAIAKFNQGLVDEAGQPFNVPNIEQFDLPSISADRKNASELLQQFKKMSKILSSVSLIISQLTLEGSKIAITTKEGLIIVANDKEAVSQLKRFVKVYPKLIKQNHKNLQRADLRYRHGLALQWV